MLYFWTKWGKEARVLLWNKCLRCVLPLLIHVGKWSFFVDYQVRVIPDGGVFTGWYCGVSNLMKIPPGWQSCSYSRVFGVVGWCVMEWPMNGKSEIWISLHNVCSMSIRCCLIDWCWSICKCIGVSGQWNSGRIWVLPGLLEILSFVGWLFWFWVSCFSSRILI